MGEYRRAPAETGDLRLADETNRHGANETNRHRAPETNRRRAAPENDSVGRRLGRPRIGTSRSEIHPMS